MLSYDKINRRVKYWDSRFRKIKGHGQMCRFYIIQDQNTNYFRIIFNVYSKGDYRAEYNKIITSYRSLNEFCNTVVVSEYNRAVNVVCKNDNDDKVCNIIKIRC